jgi:hypothetical protein
VKTFLRSAVVGLVLVTLARPAASAPSDKGSRHPKPHPRRIVAARAPHPASGLYSQHARRLVQSYLRLKLLEMREADLERARRVIEGKLGIDALLGGTTASAPPGK